MPLWIPAFAPLKFRPAGYFRRTLPALAAVLVFAAGYLGGRALLNGRGSRQPSSLGQTSRTAAVTRPAEGQPPRQTHENAAVSRESHAAAVIPPSKPAASGPARSASSSGASPSAAQAAGSSISGSSGNSTLGATYEVKGKQSVLSLARMYLTRTSYMTVPELETAIREASGGKRDDTFKKGDRVVIPGFLTEPIVEKPVLIPRNTEIRGIYLTGYTAGSIRGIELIRRWRDAGGNAVVFDIKDFDGPLNVPFHHPLAPTRKPLISNLPKFTRYLHSLHLHAIGRIALFRDAYQAENHPELAVRSRRTGKPWRENGKLAWVDPSNPAVQNYLLDLAKMVAASGVDEVQFDYVRFPAEGDQKDAEFTFEARHPTWQRSDVIADFLSRVYSELHPMGVLLSLDVFGVMAWQRSIDLAHTGQDIAAMARHADVLSPMIYPSHFFNMDGYKMPGDYPRHFIGESMERFRAITADSKVVLRPWLQAFAWRTPIYSPAYIVTQVSVSREEGGIGYLFWNARNDYSKLFPAMTEMRAAKGRRETALAGPGSGAGQQAIERQ